MLVVNFAVSGRHNCVSVAGAAYVYVRTRYGSFVLPTVTGAYNNMRPD